MMNWELEYPEPDDSEAFEFQEEDEYVIKGQNRRQKKENENKMIVSNRNLKTLIYPLSTQPRRKSARKRR